MASWAVKDGLWESVRFFGRADGVRVRVVCKAVSRNLKIHIIFYYTDFLRYLCTAINN